MKRFNLLATIALLLFAFSAQIVSAATFKDLTNYQKQKYWEYMKADCAPLIKNYKEFKVCEAKAIEKAAKEKEPIAAYCTDNDGINFLKLGMVKSNFYPNGKLDYSQTLKNGTTYVMEGACGKDKKYYAIQKNCAELGNYKAKDGVCVIANHAPKFEVEALPDSTVNEGEYLALKIVATDEDGDALQYSDENLPKGANFDWTEEKPEHGVFSWEPTYQQSGEYEVIFHVTDGKLKDNLKAKIIVTDKNQTPEMIIVMNSTEVNEGEEHKIYLHASDKDGDPLEFSAENLPEGSTFDNDVPPAFPLEFGSKHALFTWTPGYQQAGEYEITFKVSDGKGGEYSLKAPVTVKNVNAAPELILVMNSTEVNEGDEYKIYLYATDKDGDTIEFSAENLPAGSVLDKDASVPGPIQEGTQHAVFTWTPSYQQAGNYEITFKVSDGNLNTNVNLKINVISQEKWIEISQENSPDSTIHHTAIWTGKEMIIWGGQDGSNNLNSGKKYNPATNTWTSISMINAPSSRSMHSAIWTGQEMIIWGGNGNTDIGGRYNPETDTWNSISTINSPSSRYLHTAIWTGEKMVIWGGMEGANKLLNNGGIYDPITDTWDSISVIDSPEGRRYGYMGRASTSK